MIANLGRFRWVLNPRLDPVSWFVRTEEALVSLPAAGIVRTAPVGSPCSGFFFRLQNSQMSVSGLAAPMAMAFAVSMAEPPPMPKIKSAPKVMAV